MKLRLSNRQRPFFAAFLVVSLLFVTQSKAQNQCAQVFIAVKNSTITADIAELAKMKLEIDLATAQGNGDSLLIKSLAQQFPNSWRSVLTKNGLNEVELKSLIVGEIARLQNAKVEKQNSSISKREIITLARPEMLPVYVRKNTLSLDKFLGPVSQGLGIHKILHFSGNLKKIVVGGGSQGMGRVIDLDSGSVRSLGGFFSELQVSSDGTRVLSLNADREFVSFNLKNFGEDQKVALDQSKFPRNELGYHRLDLSPDKKTLAVANQDGKVMLFSMATGDMIASVKNDWISSDKITAVRFTDNNRIIFDSGRALFRFDITTNIREVLPIPQDGVMSMGISMDKAFVTLVQMRNAIAIDLKSFQIAHIEEVFTANTNLQAFKEVPGDSRGHFVLIDRSGETSPSIYAPDHLTEKVFDFDDAYKPGSQRVVLDMLFSPEKESVHVFYRENDQYMIDEWSFLE